MAGFVDESFRHRLWPTQPSIRDEWMTCGSHLSPLEKKGEVRSIQFDLSMSFVQFLRCHDRLLDSLFLYVICDSIDVYVYCGSCAMRFGLCLDFVIGSCGSSFLQMYCNPLTLMFAPSFIECLLRDSTSCLGTMFCRTLAMPEWCKIYLYKDYRYTFIKYLFFITFSLPDC